MIDENDYVLQQNCPEDEDPEGVVHLVLADGVPDLDPAEGHPELDYLSGLEGDYRCVDPGRCDYHDDDVFLDRLHPDHRRRFHLAENFPAVRSQKLR